MYGMIFTGFVRLRFGGRAPNGLIEGRFAPENPEIEVNRALCSPEPRNFRQSAANSEAP